jgi:glutathione S-transferase
MIVLHHCVSARSFRPLWMLEEMQLPYQLRMLPFPPRTQQPDYLNDNPLGTVPLLVDGPVRMTESAAMCEYLATRHGPSPLAVWPTETDYGNWLNFLHFGEATLTFPQTLVLRYSRFEPEERRQPQVVADYTRWFLSRLRALETALTSRDWLCADRFTAADVSVGYAVMLAQHLALDPHFGPAVAAWWRRLQQRPGYQRALEAQDIAALTQGVSPLPAPDTAGF